MRYYFLYFLVFAFLLCGGIYTLHSSEIVITLFSKTFSFPLSLWILGSLALFFFGSLIFFANRWMKDIFSNLRLKKDLDSLLQQIYNQVLQKDSSTHFKTQTFQMLSKILKRMHIKPKLDTPPSENPKIDQLFTELEELERGEVFKGVLQPETLLWQKNVKNKIKSDLKFAQKILDENNTQELKSYALDVLLTQDTIQEKVIQKLIKQDLNTKDAIKLLEYFLHKGYRLGKDDFLLLLKQIDSEELLSFAKLFKQYFEPAFCLALFQDLAQGNQKSQEAYVYLLLDYSMFDKAKDFLNEHDELLLARAYLELKENNKNYPLELFF